MTLPTLLAGNRDFAADRFTAGLRMMPALRTIVIGCVDPRVDPATVLGIDLGAAAILRNVGGRVTPGVVRELHLLRAVSEAAGGQLGAGWTIVVMQHTDCGITRLADGDPAPLAAFFETDPAGVDARQVQDPYAAVAADVDALAGAGLDGVTVAGLVYDVATGRAEVVAGPVVL